MFSAPTLAKFAGILYLTLELGVLHIALTHMGEHTKGVVTACKGGHDYQPLAVSYTITILSPPLKYALIFRPGPLVCPDSLTWQVPWIYVIYGTNYLSFHLLFIVKLVLFLYKSHPFLIICVFHRFNIDSRGISFGEAWKYNSCLWSKGS